MLLAYDLWAFVSENRAELVDGLVNTLKVSAHRDPGAYVIGSCSAPHAPTGSR